MIVVGVFYYG